MSREKTRSPLTASRPSSPRASEDTTNPFEAVTPFFDRAAEHIAPPDEMREVLRTSYRELAVQVPVRMDGGALQVSRGYRVQHNVHARLTVDAIPLRLAAFAIAVEKVDRAARLRGYV